MPGLKDLVERTGGVIQVPPDRPQPRFEPPRATLQPARTGYGIGALTPPPGTYPHLTTNFNTPTPQNPAYLTNTPPVNTWRREDGTPATAEDFKRGKEAGHRYNQELLVRQYDKYLRDNGVDDDEINDIIQDIVAHHDTSRKPTYSDSKE